MVFEAKNSVKQHFKQGFRKKIDGCLLKKVLFL